MALRAGDRVAGKYRIERLLGEGGMGAVYVAENEKLRKRVALKILGDGLAGHAEIAERFVREAIAASTVKHPSVVEIYDTDVHEGMPWIAMELLEGETLGQRLERGPLPLDETLDIVLEALGAIVAVHAGGIIHRDLKPDNIFLERLPSGGRRVKVLDFGIAKIVDRELDSKTKTGMALGTPFYLAPEQATNAKSTDARADVYAVGAILFHALTGQLPYDGDTFGELLRQMFTTGPRSLAAVAPHLPPAITSIVDRCLRVDPNQRPESAAALAAELERARREAPSPVIRTVPMMEAQSWVTAQSGPVPVQSGPVPVQGWGPAPAHQSWNGYGNPPGVVGTPSPATGWAPPPRSGGSGLGVVIVALVTLGLLAVLGAGAGAIFVWRQQTTRQRQDDERARVEREPTPPPPAVSLSSLTAPGFDADRIRVDIPATAPFRGPDDALVTIIVFSDYQCPFCQRVEATIDRLRQTYGQDLRIVWRDYPLPFHTDAMPAAELAREAYVQGGNDRYWQMHDILFANREALSRADLERYAPQIGLDLTRVRAALDGRTHRTLIQTDVETATRIGVSGTPTFFIDGRNLVGAQPYEAFDEMIREEMELARQLVARGVPRDQLYERFLEHALDRVPQPEAEDPAPDPSADRLYAIAVPANAPSRGPSTARVTLQFFGDFQCPFCARVQPTLDALLARHPNDLRIIFRNYPLAFHQNAALAAEAAMEVYSQTGNAGFWRYHDLLFQNQQALSRGDLESYAQQIPGLDMVRFRNALDAHTQRSTVQADIQAVDASGAQIGTPSAFINGRLVQGAVPIESFEAAVQRALETVPQNPF